MFVKIYDYFKYLQDVALCVTRLVHLVTHSIHLVTHLAFDDTRSIPTVVNLIKTFTVYRKKTNEI